MAALQNALYSNIRFSSVTHKHIHWILHKNKIFINYKKYLLAPSKKNIMLNKSEKKTALQLQKKILWHWIRNNNK